jgi:hypothetical protein
MYDCDGANSTWELFYPVVFGPITSVKLEILFLIYIESCFQIYGLQEE